MSCLSFLLVAANTRHWSLFVPTSVCLQPVTPCSMLSTPCFLSLTPFSTPLTPCSMFIHILALLLFLSTSASLSTFSFGTVQNRLRVSLPIHEKDLLNLFLTALLRWRLMKNNQIVTIATNCNNFNIADSSKVSSLYIVSVGL